MQSSTISGARFDDARRALVETKRLLDPSWPPRLRLDYENMAGLYFDSAGQPRVRASTTRYDDGIVVRNYATALMEAGHLEEAESAYRDALPQVRRVYGSAAFVLHDAASLLARRGQIDDAARVSAYAENVYAGMGRKPRGVRSVTRNSYVRCFPPSVPPKRSWR